MELNNRIKKGIAGAVAILVIILVLVLVFQNVGPITSDENGDMIPEEQFKEFYVKDGCEEIDSEGVYKYAIENKDILACDCALEESHIASCKESVQTTIFQSKALETLDSDLCDNIDDDATLDACVSIVNNAVNDIGEKDPRYIALLDTKKQDFDSAIEGFEKLVDQNNEDIASLISLASAYANKALREHLEDDLVPKALDLIEQAKALNPEYAEIYTIEGYIYEVKPDLPQSISSYTTALKKDESYIPAYTGRGHAYNKMGLLDEAEADLEKAKSLDTKREHPDIYGQLCRLYSQDSSTVEKAIENCEIAINIPSSDYDNLTGSYLTLAEIYMNMEKYSQAEELLLVAVSIFPESPDVHIGLARLYNRQQNYGLAQTHSDSALEVDSARATAYQTRAYALYQQGQFNEAISAALLGLENIDDDASLLVPNKPPIRKDLYYTLANVYAQLGDSENENKYSTLGDAI